MDIQTSRFGQVQFDAQDVIDFPEGILGFGHAKKYILVEDPHDEVFIWLQSCDQPDIAFPVLEPELFVQGYEVKLNKHELDTLQLTSMEGSRTFVIVTIPDDPTHMTANIKAPLIVNVAKRCARQCVLQDNDLAIREPVFKRLQQRLVQNPDVKTPLRSDNKEVFVRLPEQPEKSL